jgi:CRISPR-associated endonuclease/helicase Cas3
MWAAKNCANRRLFFCYPTTGTATEGFKDYLHEIELKTDLFHSRRAVDFEIILETDADAFGRSDDGAVHVEALDAWSTPIVACTVDSVLGIIQNNKRGIFAWPAIAQSAVVFDEIHAYDDRLFGALLRFLRDLSGVPVLLMTASLPKPREAALKNTLKQFRNIDWLPIGGPNDLEKRPRYRKIFVDRNDPMPLVEAELHSGGKVLWVCNTVRRVMDAAIRSQHLSPELYHSRFKYIDRVERHRRVVQAFQPEHRHPVLAITSQVCEMSLDLKGCTLLVTDNAPVPSLIQRLGRLNRAASDGDPTRPFLIVEPDSELPYSAADLENARRWHQRLPDGAICQMDLVEAWEQSADGVPEQISSTWLDGGPSTEVSELRDGSPGIAVVMRSDVGRLKRSADLMRYVLPMPSPPGNSNWRGWPRKNGVPIVDDVMITYDPERGAKWQE